MSEDTTVSPSAAPAAAASAQVDPATQALTEKNRAIDQEGGGAGNDEAAEATKEPKPEKTPEQRELARQQRKIDRLVRQREELRAQLTQRPIEDNNPPQANDSERLTLSRAELQKLVELEARKVAPAITAQQAVIEHRTKLIDTMAKDWGQEKFDALASDLDEAFGGLRDRSGRPKAATDAIFESDAPKALIEYLADPDHAEEAEALSRMSATQAGRAIAKLEAKVAAESAKTKQQPSNAASPLEPVKGAGRMPGARLQDLEGDAFEKRRRAQIAARRGR